MNKYKFNLINRLTAVAVLVISAITYICTIEPTASFWDCGEFIASSYKLEVGHPPGNPVFQLFARFFSMFTGAENAAVAVNVMSALCSAFTIFFLYLTIVFFVKRVIRKEDDGSFSTGAAVAIIGSGVVGALAYTFSDTFWFSAVEGEVYAMSSLFTAMVFWAMTKWYEQENRAYADRWIVLIAFLMGLSIGIHLLNLLAIPAIVFMFYYKKKEKAGYSFKQLVGISLISVVILGVLVFLFIPWLPKLAAYFDLAFVNWFGLPYNSGAVFFMAVLIALCFWGLFKSLKEERVFINTSLLCATSLVVGFSLFSIVIIRSSVKTPTNEYQPDNPFTLVRYLSREQYGSTPLLYGQYFDAPYTIKSGKYWAPLNGKYVHADGPADAVYSPEGKMLFPRMWASSPDGRYENFYDAYTGGQGRKIKGAKYRKPTMGANLNYFLDYQLGWMYWRYFMWNFAGRQNDVHSPTPGNIFHGNWECGIKFIDNWRLGDQADAPGILADNKGKNHYFLLPLLLGILGLVFQFDRDKRGTWLIFLMFFMTGIAIVLYLNQPPYQVRERDYAYAGSFYFFAVWIGFAVAAIYSWITESRKIKAGPVVSGVVTIACLGVPALMAAENWDDHDRSHRFTSTEMACNYLNSVGQNGIIITHGDNDTFPLWYAQEIESVRTDVRVVNTSLLGTDWHIDQMKYAVNESAPLPLTVGPEQYLYGTNEYVFIIDEEKPMYISDVMKIFKDPSYKVDLTRGTRADFICSRKIVVPVNKENVIKYGILSPEFEGMIPDSIVLRIPDSKDYITKPELFMLDLLSNYQWDRPINVLNMGGDLNIGIKDYLMYEGFSYKLTPLRNKISNTDPGIVDVEGLYDKMKNVYKWDALSRTDYFVDYQNYYTFLGVLSQRSMFVSAANAFIKAGKEGWALEMLDKCQEMVKEENFPLETIPVGLSTNDYMVVNMVSLYYRLGQKDKARNLGVKLANELINTARFYLEFYDYAHSDFELCGQYIYYLSEEMKLAGDKDLANEVITNFNRLIKAATGTPLQGQGEKTDSLELASDK
ncbi:MAG: DUF2723 domain-containing protein [Bacteroidales bacterium]|nr:DUF2723 domain-containing protein [Bacteroidales bacterium]